MNNTPTPRTDAGGRYCSHKRRERWIKTVPLKTSELQTELAAAREEIVKLTKGWADCVLRLSKAEEQRDRLAEECAKIRDVAERAINYLDQSYRDGFSDEVSELRYELADVKGGADES